MSAMLIFMKAIDQPQGGWLLKRKREAEI